jgi:hypothetical protein
MKIASHNNNPEMNPPATNHPAGKGTSPDADIPPAGLDIAEDVPQPRQLSHHNTTAAATKEYLRFVFGNHEEWVFPRAQMVSLEGSNSGQEPALKLQFKCHEITIGCRHETPEDSPSGVFKRISSGDVSTLTAYAPGEEAPGYGINCTVFKLTLTKTDPAYELPNN